MTEDKPKDITSMFEIGDLIDVRLKIRSTPLCSVSETSLIFSPCQTKLSTMAVIGRYVGDRPGLIKIDPTNKELLDSPEGLSRYVVIKQDQIEEAYVYKPKKVFP